MVQMKSKGQQPRDPGQLIVQFHSEGSLLENALLLEVASPFVLFGPSTGWRRPTHIMESNLFTQTSSM